MTPETAKNWLQFNAGNRPIKGRKVGEYARDMAANRWRLTGEPIIRDDNRRLLNGQHRLLACIRADEAFQTVVIEGVRPESFTSMDRGSMRTVGDILGIEGHSQGNLIAATAVLIWKRERGITIANSGTRPTSEESLDVLHRHPEVLDLISPARRLRGLLPAATAVFCHWELRAVDGPLADRLFDRLATGERLNPGDPVLLLREALLRRSMPRDPETLSILIRRTWNAWVTGRDVRLVKRPARGETEPDLLSPTSDRWTR